jgi:hypothetical protein
MAVGLVAGIAILDALTPSDVGPAYPTLGRVAHLLKLRGTDSRGFL